MEGKPLGITYSRQLTSPTRPVQQGTPVGAPAPAQNREASFAAAATGTVTTPSGTTHLTINRAVLIAGLLFCLASPASLGVATYGFLGMFLIPAALALILALAFNRAWSYIVATILGVLFPLFVLVMFAPHEDGFNPLNRGVFGMALFNVCALPLILTGGIGGFRNARGKTPVSLGSGFRTAPGVFALCVCALLVGGLTTSYVANTEAIATPVEAFDGQPQAATSTVMEGFKFEPNVLNVGVATVTEITIVNRDPTTHTFTYRNGDVEYNHEVLPGQSANILVFFDTAGTYNFWCIPHSGGHDDTADDSMVGKIVVA